MRCAPPPTIFYRFMSFSNFCQPLLVFPCLPFPTTWLFYLLRVKFPNTEPICPAATEEEQREKAAPLSCFGSIIDDAPPLCRESDRNFLLEIPPDDRVKGKLPGGAAFRSLSVRFRKFTSSLEKPRKTAQLDNAARSKALGRDALPNAAKKNQ